MSIWHLVTQAGPVAKGVLLVLLAFSVVSWTIIIAKVRAFRRAEAQSDSFLKAFRESKNLSATYEEARKRPHSPVAALFREGFRELSYHLKGNPAQQDGPTAVPAERPLLSDLLQGLHRILRHASLKELADLERSMIFLATTGTVTPFIGLFGTVWGIMDAFAGIGAAGSANLGAVAPGIAEALVATALGLFAAIPAVIGYNHLLNRIKGIGTRLDLFTLEFLSLAERMAVRGR
ncbi:MAG: protein TolQ [Candidatus Methylomirabilales bacterium]